MNATSGRIRPVFDLHLALGTIFMAASASIAPAHHILGTPHYAYTEEYPQTPVLTYYVREGDYDVKLTGYPGHPVPGERWSLNVYILDEQGIPYDDTVNLIVTREQRFGPDTVIYGPIDANLEEAVYKFHPKFATEANYRVELAFEADGNHWNFAMPVVVGKPRSAVVVLCAVAFGILFLAILARAIHIKSRRRKRLNAKVQVSA